MEQAVTTTVEMDRSGYDDLANQLITSKGQNPNDDADIREKQGQAERQAPVSKKYTFRKGDETLELDEDYELELTADKKPIRMSIRELKDRAAGDVAVKNRMHALAEEKKRVAATIKQFATLAKDDPLGALEYISERAKEADGEFEYQKYVEKLAEQAEKLGKMDEKERKAWEREKKLSKAEQDLSQKERQQAVVLRKQEMLSEYSEIGDSEFGQMVEAVLSNDELLEGLKDENDVMDKVEELIQETLTQRDIMSVIRDINPSHLNNNQLIFAVSDQLRQNPDFDEEDVRDIIRDLIGTPKKETLPQRDRDVRTLSSKARQAMPVQKMREQGADDFQLLQAQLLERKKEFSKTPLYKR